MNLSEYVRFAEIDFNKEELPEYIITIKKEYNEQLKANNYILEQGQYDEYAAKFARIHDWLSIQFARAKYLKKSLENRLDLIIMREQNNAPVECKSGLARKKWVEQNSVEYQTTFENLALSEGYYALFEKEIDSAKMHHYLCKGMSHSIDTEKPIGGFSS